MKIIKIDYTKITEVSHGRFFYEGKEWVCSTKGNGRPLIGTSPRGLWNHMTNGEECTTVYKADVMKVSPSAAVALFN